MENSELIETGFKVVISGLTLITYVSLLGHLFHQGGFYQALLMPLMKLDGQVKYLKRDLRELKDLEKSKDEEIVTLRAKLDAQFTEQQDLKSRYKAELQEAEEKFLAGQGEMKMEIGKLRGEKIDLKGVVQCHPATVAAASARDVQQFKAFAGLRKAVLVLLAPALYNGYCKGVDDARVQFPDLNLYSLAHKDL